MRSYNVVYISANLNTFIYLFAANNGYFWRSTYSCNILGTPSDYADTLAVLALPLQCIVYLDRSHHPSFVSLFPLCLFAAKMDEFPESVCFGSRKLV